MRTIIPEEEVKQFIILFVNRHDRFPTTRETIHYRGLRSGIPRKQDQTMRTIIPEEEVKQFIILFVNRHDRFPTTREIRDHFGSGGLNRYSEISKEVKERYFVQAEQFKNETHKECHQIKLLLELIEEKLTKLQMLKS